MSPIQPAPISSPTPPATGPTTPNLPSQPLRPKETVPDDPKEKLNFYLKKYKKEIRKNKNYQVATGIIVVLILLILIL